MKKTSIFSGSKEVRPDRALKPPVRAFVITASKASFSRAAVSKNKAYFFTPGKECTLDQASAEAISLASAVGLVVVGVRHVKLRAIRPSTLFGFGQAEDLALRIKAENVSVVIVDWSLSPIQQRNLEQLFQAKVLDRTGLILEIFGERARTREGVLQVELAHLDYQKSRLVRSWTHLERQRGGFGFMGGPGEMQIEADRRLISERMAKLRKELEEVRRTRSLHRKARRQVPYHVVALVGYTNAGKSTLFNALTVASVFARDQLFATLDPTMREIILPSRRKIILSDTVGFISHLPMELINAFKATLEEVADADLILHVRDISHPETAEQRQNVLRILDDMVKKRILPENWQENTIEVLNKSDLLNREDAEEFIPSDGQIMISALEGKNLNVLSGLIDTRLSAGSETVCYRLSATDGVGLSWLWRHGEVLKQEMIGEEAELTVRLSLADKARFDSFRFGRIIK